MQPPPPSLVTQRRRDIWKAGKDEPHIIGIPTGFVLATRHQVASAVKSATAMHLEEHESGEVLATRPLARLTFPK